MLICHKDLISNQVLLSVILIELNLQFSDKKEVFAKGSKISKVLKILIFIKQIHFIKIFKEIYLQNKLDIIILLFLK